MHRPPLCQGRIIAAIPPSGRGQDKIRPMVIGTDRKTIATLGRFTVIVLSTKFSLPLRPVEIFVPIDDRTRNITKLRKECVAVCNWIEELSVAEIVEDRGGWMPPSLVEQIIKLAGMVRESYR